MRLSRLAPGGSVGSDLGLRPGIFAGSSMSGFSISSWLNRRTAVNLLNVAPWANAYWTEGNEFKQLELANGANVSNWPDEIGAADLSSYAPGSTQLIYRSTGLNGRPSIEAAALSTLFSTGVATDYPQPWSFWCIANSTLTSGKYGGSNSNNAIGAGMQRNQVASGVAASFTDFGVGTHFLGYVANGAATEVYKNGVLHATVDAGTLTSTTRRVLFGRSVSIVANAFSGHMVFAAWLDRALTTNELLAMRTLSQSLYATP